MKLREEVRWLGEHYQASQQRFCELMQIAVSSYRYRTTTERRRAARAVGGVGAEEASRGATVDCSIFADRQRDGA